MPTIQGGCKCRAIGYTYEGEFGVITICHCADCRTLQGGGGVVAVPVASAGLRWTSGHALITEFASSPGKQRGFCSRCGTPLYSRRENLPAVMRLRIGSIRSAIDLLPTAHIFCADLPPWATLDDTLPRYARHEPERD